MDGGRFPENRWLTPDSDLRGSSPQDRPLVGNRGNWTWFEVDMTKNVDDISELCSYIKNQF